MVVKANQKLDTLTENKYKVSEQYLRSKIRQANRQPTHELAIAQLQQLEPELPNSVKPYYYQLLIKRYIQLGKTCSFTSALGN